MSEYKEAIAIFNYSVGIISDQINVESKAPISQSRDDWIIFLALKAGQEVAKLHKTDLQAISLKLENIILK